MIKSMAPFAFVHHLYHACVEVNYADRLIPFHHWSGTRHDRTEVGEAPMDARYQAKVARVNARRVATAKAIGQA